MSEGDANVEQPESSGQAFTERRSAYRLNKVLGAEIEHQGEVTKARLFVIDISVSGFKATCHFPLPENENQSIRISLAKDEPPLECAFRLVWQKELTVSGMFQMGGEFVELSEEDGGRLEAFIEAEKEAAAAKSGGSSSSAARPWTMIRN